MYPTKRVSVTYYWWPLRHTWIGGITFGHHIFFKRRQGEVSDRLFKHEMAHVAQIERMGFVRFYLKYLWYNIRYGYKKNPLELEAIKAAGG